MLLIYPNLGDPLNATAAALARRDAAAYRAKVRHHVALPAPRKLS